MLVVIFPPGGFVVADLDGADECLQVMAQTCRVNVLAPSYAVAPEHPFPAAVEDAVEAFRWLQKTSMNRRLTMREVADAAHAAFPARTPLTPRRRRASCACR